MNVIYTVTVLHYGSTKKSPQIEPSRPRVWGWYASVHDAEIAILTNATDMFECAYYTHAIIEEVDEGIAPICRNVGVYKATYDKEHSSDPLVKKIKKPAWCKRFINWSMG